MAKLRKDYQALEDSGEITAQEAAKLLGIAAGTLKRMRDNAEGPGCRQVHKRLTAYVALDIAALAKRTAGMRQIDKLDAIAGRAPATAKAKATRKPTPAPAADALLA